MAEKCFENITFLYAGNAASALLASSEMALMRTNFLMYAYIYLCHIHIYICIWLFCTAAIFSSAFFPYFYSDLHWSVSHIAQHASTYIDYIFRQWWYSISISFKQLVNFFLSMVVVVAVKNIIRLIMGKTAEMTIFSRI